MNIINLCIVFAQNCIAVLCRSLLHLPTDTLELFPLLGVHVDDVIVRVDNNYEGHTCNIVQAITLLTGTLHLFLVLGVDDVIIRVDNNYEGHTVILCKSLLTFVLTVAIVNRGEWL